MRYQDFNFAVASKDDLEVLVVGDGDHQHGSAQDQMRTNLEIFLKERYIRK